MDLAWFARGFLLGFAFAAPIGPIGLVCIRQTLAGGLARGLVAGLGVATADALYSAIAAFGLGAVVQATTGQRQWLSVIAGAFLCYLGLRTLAARPPRTTSAADAADLRQAFGLALALTLANPLAILSFGAVFAALGLGASGAAGGAPTALVLGVFSGSAAWWIALATAVAVLRTHLRPAALRWANVLSGSLIVAFGILLLVRAARL